MNIDERRIMNGHAKIATNPERVGDVYRLRSDVISEMFFTNTKYVGAGRGRILRHTFRTVSPHSKIVEVNSFMDTIRG